MHCFVVIFIIGTIATCKNKASNSDSKDRTEKITSSNNSKRDKIMNIGHSSSYAPQQNLRPVQPHIRFYSKNLAGVKFK